MDIKCWKNHLDLFLGHFRSKISVFWTFLKKYCSDRSDIAYLDRSYQYLQLFYWHHGQKKMSRAFRGVFSRKISVFRTFLKKFCPDRSDIAYSDRSYQYLQLFYWHQALENSFRPSILLLSLKKGAGSKEIQKISFLRV